ncbi:MAG: TonB-dependent receptor [Bryobacteraceae bacterium]
MGRRLIILLALAGANSSAQRVGTPTDDDLTNLSVEDLFQLEVTSVGRKAQELSKAPAAIFVLTAEDIRRSGATSIPEALQWVPGLTVLSVDGIRWTISARGSASLYADKMLVMIDGRSLYTPLFGGVLWDLVDVPLENIERIEVVRGPGAVMWGPNAVNGVINIITKKARDTKGAEVSVASGNQLRGTVMARWSDGSDKLSYQVWTKLEDIDPASSSAGYYYVAGINEVIKQPQPVADLNTQSARVGFRVDGQASEKDQWMVQGDLYKIGGQDDLGYPVLLPAIREFVTCSTGGEGGFLQALWTRTNSTGNESTLQFTYDHDRIDYSFVGGMVNNLTLDYQKRLQTSDRNEVYWGAGFQQYWDDTETERVLDFNPADSVYRVGDAVVRDEFQLIPDRLLAVAGVRVDFGTYSRFQFQPSFRLLYTPSQTQSFWAGVSRAVRVPDRFNRDAQLDEGAVLMGGIPVNIEVLGSEAIRPEVEDSLEAGYRFQSGQRWSVDASTFWSYYNRLVGIPLSGQPQIQWIGSIPSVFVALQEQNLGTGRSYGGELSATWQATRKWRWIPGYSYLNETKWLPPGDGWLLGTSSPAHQGWLRSQYDFSRKWQADLMARARSRNMPFDTPGVVLFDARVSWRPSRDTELSFTVQNLGGRSVLETYSESPLVAIPLQRTFVFKWVQRF